MNAERNFSFVFTLDASSPNLLYTSMFNLALKLGWSMEYIAKEASEKETPYKVSKTLSFGRDQS